MFHINEKNEPKKCRAKVPQNCRFYKGEDDSRHYENISEATQAVEKILGKEHNILSTTKKYSFIKDFKELEEKFKEDHEGIPTRFYNYDLIGKTITVYGPYNLDNAPPNNIRVDQKKLIARIFQSTSAPKDTKISDQEAEEAFKKLGMNNVTPLTDEKTLKALKTQRAWVQQLEDDNGKTKQVIISDDKFGQPFARYSFRSGGLDDNLAGPSFTNVDLRSVVGAVRAEKLTNIPIFKDSIINNGSWGSTTPEYKAKMLVTIAVLQEEQEKSLDFKARQKYVKESSSKVATVWKNKKNPKETHEKAAKETKLNKDFTNIEIDDDVDLVEFKKFADDYDEVREKLPKIPEDRKPRIAFRKLGKHSSNNFTVAGLYSPSHNAIAISVEDSSSTIHELAHMYDFNLTNNASMKQEFRKIQSTYAKNIKLPATAQDKSEYYTSSHEVFARGFEIYANQKLGIDNKLLNKDKFTQFDYEPINNNPEFKKEVFTFYDKLFDNTDKK